MGCLVRLGCLVMLAICAVGAWFTRDRWMPESWRKYLAPPPPKVAAWEPLAAAGADRTRVALDKLSKPRGPVFETLSGADVVSFAFREVSKRLPGEADSMRP